MKGRKLTLYPFHSGDIPFIKYFNAFQKDFILAHICAAPGSGLIGHDCAYGHYQTPIGVFVEEDPFSALKDSDSLCILFDDSGTLDEEISSLIHDALTSGKEVFCYTKLASEARESFVRLSQGLGTPFHCEYGKAWEAGSSIEYRYMYKPAASVLFIGGIAPDIDQREILLGMAAELSARGLKVSGISQSPSDEFLGFYSCRKFLETDVVSGVKQLNQLFRTIEEKEYPDVILAELPGTMIRFNDMAVGDFGSYAYLFSQAVQADGCICSILSNMYSPEFARNLNEEFLHRYNFPIDGFHIANCLMDFDTTLRERKLCLFRINPEPLTEKVDSLRQDTDIPCFDLTQVDEQKLCADRLFETLSE